MWIETYIKRTSMHQNLRYFFKIRVFKSVYSSRSGVDGRRGAEGGQCLESVMEVGQIEA